MSNRVPLPKKAELEKLLQRLLPANEEMDEVSASIILEEQGIDQISLAKALRERINRRIAETQAKGEDVSVAISELASTLERNIQLHETDMDDPDNWINALLSGRYPEAQTGSTYVEAYRPRGEEKLTEEDIQILQDLQAELEARAKELDS